jgi:hypothetical protein
MEGNMAEVEGGWPLPARAANRSARRQRHAAALTGMAVIRQRRLTAGAEIVLHPGGLTAHQAVRGVEHTPYIIHPVVNQGIRSCLTAHP